MSIVCYNLCCHLGLHLGIPHYALLPTVSTGTFPTHSILKTTSLAGNTRLWNFPPLPLQHLSYYSCFFFLSFLLLRSLWLLSFLFLSPVVTPSILHAAMLTVMAVPSAVTCSFPPTVFPTPLVAAFSAWWTGWFLPAVRAPVAVSVAVSFFSPLFAPGKVF